MEIIVDKDVLICENWYKGKITNKENIYPFWLLETKQPSEDTYFVIKWFYKAVPKEIRKLENDIIKEFKNMHI